MTRFGVRLRDGDSQAVDIASDLSSLPRSFALRPDGSVAALIGTGAWCAQALSTIDHGARGLLIVDPQPVPVVELDAVIDSAVGTGTAIRLARGWASNPAVREFAATPPASGPVLVDCQVYQAVGTDLEATLAAQVDLVLSAFRSCSLEIRSVARSNGWAYTAAAFLRNQGWQAPALLTGVQTSGLPAHATLRELVNDGRRALTVHSGHAARPAVLYRGDAFGEHQSPTTYETGYRAAWRSLHDDMKNGLCDTADLADFRAAVLAVAGLSAERPRP